MLNEARFDFSKETNIKESLWEKMAEIAAKKTISREEISFEGLDSDVGKDGRAKIAEGNTLAVEPQASKNRGKSK